MSELLNARDRRTSMIRNLLLSYPLIIAIKPNTPGENKQTKEAYVLTRIFFNYIKTIYTIKNQIFLDEGEGPIFLFCLEGYDALIVKNRLVDVEDMHPLGRFIDLDVYDTHTSISRIDLGYPHRKCFICQEDAYMCSRSQKHTLLELNIYIVKSVRDYMKWFITTVIDESMIRELELEYKFGCVTKTTCGSHPDMNYEMMIKAKHAILPFLCDIFFLAYDGSDKSDMLLKARKIGKRAEQAMLLATDGVNAYKGLIFIVGFLLLGIGSELSHHILSMNIFDQIKDLSQPVFADFNKDDQTFGLHAYHTYHIRGARGEVLDGFPTLQEMIHKYPYQHPIDDTTLRQILIDIIILAEDTVLLKRSKDLKSYSSFKEKLKVLNSNCLDEVIKLNTYAIKHHLSVGGSADLLVAYMCLQTYLNDFHTN